MSESTARRKIRQKREAALNTFAQQTIQAQYDEMDAAVVALADTAREACPYVVALHLAPSDQGDWLQFDVATCSVHVHPSQCPANTIDVVQDLSNYAGHLYVAHLNHLSDIASVQVPRTFDNGVLMTLTMQQCEVVRESFSLPATTLHINTLAFGSVALITDSVAELLNDGDCGSVWGERREQGCPAHVIINDPSHELVEYLTEAGVAYAVTDKADWSIERERHNWTEPACSHTR